MLWSAITGLERGCIISDQLGMKTLIVLTAVIIAQAAFAEDVKPTAEKKEVVTEATYILCQNKQTVRTVRVEKNEGGGCVTKYTKQGVDEVVATSWTEKRCKAVLGNIQTNLESANWKCKDISSSRVSSSISE